MLSLLNMCLLARPTTLSGSKLLQCICNRGQYQAVQAQRANPCLVHPQRAACCVPQGCNCLNVHGQVSDAQACWICCEALVMLCSCKRGRPWDLVFTLSMANTDWTCGLVRHSPLTSPSLGELSQLMVGPTSFVCSVNLLSSKSCHRNLPCHTQHTASDLS